MLTVDSLVRDYGFDLEYAAGEDGGSRPLVWAHVVDLEDPWNWVGSGELILTTGAGIPEVSGQVEWLERVIESGANGLVVAAHPESHTLGESALRRADDLQFPVLRASFHFRFTALAKEIINQALQRDMKRLAIAQRVFSHYSSALLREEGISERFAAIAESAGVDFEIVAERGVVLFSTGAMEGARAMQNVPLAQWLHPLSAELRMVHREDDRLDPALRESIVTVIVLELQRRTSEARLRHQVAAVLAEDVFSERRPLADLIGFLAENVGAARAPFTVFAVRAGTATAEAVDRLLTPDLWAIPWAGFERGDHFLVVAPSDAQTLRKIEEALDEFLVGVGKRIDEQNSPMDSLDQALLACDDAHAGARFQRVEDVLASDLLLPLGIAQCRAIAQECLAELHRYDEAQGTELLETLRMYYQEDRSPADTSARLFIHRHTLTYRLRTIEKLTGLNPSATKNIARFWIALEAAKRAQWPDPRST